MRVEREKSVNPKDREYLIFGDLVRETPTLFWAHAGEHDYTILTGKAERGESIFDRVVAIVKNLRWRWRTKFSSALPKATCFAIPIHLLRANWARLSATVASEMSGQARAPSSLSPRTGGAGDPVPRLWSMRTIQRPGGTQ